MSRSIRALLVAPLLCSLLLSACSRWTDPPCTPGPLPTLRMAIGNPAAPKILPEHASLSMPFTDWAFVRLDENGQPHPKLALAWQTTDRRTWTLTLPPNIHTHDGQLLTTERLRASLLEHARRNTQFQIWRELQSI